MDIELLGGVGGVALVMGMVQLAKEFGLSSRWAGVMAVAVGVLLAVGRKLWGGVEWTMFDAVIIGIVIGLNAAGIWSAVKAAVNRQ